MHGMYQQCNSTTFIRTVHFTDIGVGRAVLLLMLWGLAMHTWGHGRDTLQGYSANGHCWDILQLRPARMICNWALPGAAGIFCHWALLGYSLLCDLAWGGCGCAARHCRDTWQLRAVGMFADILQ